MGKRIDNNWQAGTGEMTTETQTTERHLTYMPLDAIPGAARNPKQHHVPGIAGSITKFDFIELAVLDERTGRLVAGHGRLDALRETRDAGGYPPPGGVTADADGNWLVPVVRGWASRDDVHAHAAGVALNHHTELGGWDMEGLTTILQEAADIDTGLLEAAGYTPTDLDDLCADLDEHADSNTSPESNTQQYKSIEERQAGYETTDHRQIILVYEGAQYVWVVEMLSTLGVTYGVESNAETVLKLIEAAAGETPPEA